MSCVTVITIWLGPLPAWWDRLVENRNRVGEPYRWLVFADQVEPVKRCRCGPRVELHPITLEEIALRSRAVTGVEVCLGRPGLDRRRVVDLRPMLGSMFQDYLEGASHWGFADLDVVFGRIQRFYTLQMLSLFDVLTAHQCFTSGPFTLVRNTPTCNDLWMRGRDVRCRLGSDVHRALDEIMFGKLVWDAHVAGEIHAHFGPRMSHDREAHSMELRPDGAILDHAKGREMRYDGGLHAGREVIAFHFAGAKAWPAWARLPSSESAG